MNRRMLLGSVAAAAALSMLASPSIAAARKLNFIVIYCDDLGYGDVGATGGTTIPTPNIDAMAREGVTLTDYYAPANLCTPSRAGMLTGRYPIRTGLARGVIMQNETRGLPLSEVTIAKALKPEYVSALIGKWHLGHTGPSWSPTKHGFDLFYGLPYSHDMEPLKLYEDTGSKLTELPFDYTRLQEMFYARAEKFIEDNKHKPFFLDLALSGPHLPNYPDKAFAGKSAAGAYGDVVMEIDDIVGRLMAKLKALGLDKDTLVIFTSDNGPWYEGSTGGLRQRKGGGAYDGGYRVPFIARMPGRIPSGTRSDAIAMGIDFLPTFCAMASKPLPAGVQIDGKDIGAVLTKGAATPHEELLLFSDEDVVGLRTQRWKYTSADFFGNRLATFKGRGYPQLYDMHDKSESYSVASLHPDIAAAMDKRLRALQAEFAPLRTVPPVAGPKMPEKHVPEIWQGFGAD